GSIVTARWFSTSAQLGGTPVLVVDVVAEEGGLGARPHEALVDALRDLEVAEDQAVVEFHFHDPAVHVVADRPGDGRFHPATVQLNHRSTFVAVPAAARRVSRRRVFRSATSWRGGARTLAMPTPAGPPDSGQWVVPHTPLLFCTTNSAGEV